MRSHFVVGARPGRRDRAAEKLLTTSWESSRIHFIIWQDVMEKIYKISWCCRFRRASKWKSICHGSHQLEVLFLPWPWWSIFHAYTSTWHCRRRIKFRFYWRGAMSSLRPPGGASHRLIRDVYPAIKPENHRLDGAESCLMNSLIDWSSTRFSDLD